MSTVRGEPHPPSDDIKPHPLWIGRMLGEWLDGHDLFTHVLLEIQAINELFVLAFGEPLFRTSERPRTWGWLIRPTSTELDAFVHLADKLLSENLSAKALDVAGAPMENDAGQRIGTLRRLSHLLASRAHIPMKDVREGLEPLDRVRNLRQRPAHGLSDPVTDPEYLVQQVELLQAICDSLEALRELLMRHPKCRTWRPDDQLTGKLYRM